MADGGWYVSWQGKVQGPLPWATLQELARLGRLKPEMHLSRDQRTWTPAGKWSDLFAPPPPSPASPPRKPASRPAVPACPALPLRANRRSNATPVGTIAGTVALLGVALVAFAILRRGSSDGRAPMQANADHAHASGDSGGSDALNSLERRFKNQGHPIVSAAEIGDAFDANEIAANARFKGKTLWVRGRVSHIGLDLTDTVPMVVLQRGTHSVLRDVQCLFEESAQASLARLKKGHEVIIEGTCKGLMGNVIIEDAQLVPPEVMGAIDSASLVLDGVAAEREGEPDLALARYEAALAIANDPDVRAARDRALAEVQAREKERAEAMSARDVADRATRERKNREEKQAREASALAAQAEARRLEVAGDLGGAIAKYDESLSILDDAQVRTARATLQAQLEEQLRAKIDAERRERVETLSREAADLETRGEFESALTKVDEALDLDPDGPLREARARLVGLVERACIARDNPFVPGLDDLPPAHCAAVRTLCASFSKLWERRHSPSTDIEESKRLMIDAQAIYEALPPDAKDRPTILFLDGSIRFLVARAMSDDWQAKIDREGSTKRKEALRAQFKPLYKKELDIARDRLQRCRKARPDHYATCIFEDLARAWAWVLDSSVGAAGRKDLRADMVSKKQTSNFDVDLEVYATDLGKTGRTQAADSSESGDGSEAGPQSTLNKAAFDSIRPGMSEEEVQRVLGPPTDTNQRVGSGNLWLWGTTLEKRSVRENDGQRWILIVFNNGVVLTKGSKGLK